MTPSRLGSRGRPPRLGRGISVVVRTAMGQTLDTKDIKVPQLRLRVACEPPGSAPAGGRAPAPSARPRQSSCERGNHVRRVLWLPPELGDAGPRDARAGGDLDRARAAVDRPPREGD